MGITGVAFRGFFATFFAMSCCHPNRLFYLPDSEEGKVCTLFAAGTSGRFVPFERFRKLTGFRGAPPVEGGCCELVGHDLCVVSSVLVPCGHCVGCREDKAAEWALRAEIECDRFGGGLFLTLTYSPDFVPKDGLPVKRDWQLFMKRFRNAVGVDGLRFLACGERGERFGRPHYHALVFGPGLDVPSLSGLVLLRPGDHPLYRWPLLESCWPFGFSSVGDVTPASCAYVARYGLKSLDAGGSFLLASRRPGLGYPQENKGFDFYLRGKRRAPAYFRRLALDGLCLADRLDRLDRCSSPVELQASFRRVSEEECCDLLEGFSLNRLKSSFRI